MIALVGTADGDVEFFPTAEPPSPVAAPAGWKLDEGNARFEKLENFDPSIQVVALFVTRAAAGIEIWLTGPDGALFRWDAGPAQPYSGTLCFQFALRDGEAVVPLKPGEQYRIVFAFVNADGSPIAVRSVRVAGTVPEELLGPLPEPGSHAVYKALACPRSPV